MNKEESVGSEAVGSEAYFLRALKVAPGGVHSPVRAFKSVGGTPVFFQKAKGAYLTSVDGRRYLDFCQSFGPNILGHLDDEVLTEVRVAIEEAWSFGACEPYSLALAEWIIDRLKPKLNIEKIRFVCSGTEAVMSAVRVARAYTGRNRLLKFEGCYHGHVDSLMVKAGSGLAGEAASDSAGVPEVMARDTIVAPLDDEAALVEVFAKYGHELAAVIIEPLPANFGLLIQRPQFIHKVVELARAKNVLVIFDEVISGFRVGLGGMAEQLGIQPDLVTYGKIIGGGFPVGAYAGRAQIMDLVAPSGPVYQAGTLAGSPVGMRAGLKTLQKIEREKIYDSLNKKTSAFAGRLEQEFLSADLPLQVAHQASLFWIHEKSDQVLRSPNQFTQSMRENFKKLFHFCLDEGVYLAPSAFEVGFVSHAHSASDLEFATEKILKSAKKVYGK
jgi:glutamate-1-semialdehyde 2,1-aminomutase